MLSDSIPLDLAKAVFMVENAFYGGTMDYKDFKGAINERAKLCRWRMQELKLDGQDNLAKNMVIYSLLTDTLSIRQPGTEKRITHYPLNYNLDDYMSLDNFTSHFVSTLLATNSGQCYSMPLLYLLIAEEMETEAYLSYAPRHSFIRIKDEKGVWYNLELTCRYILSDYHYMNHSYIKTEAIRSGIYLNPLGKKEVIASMLVQLGRYYLLKHGYDPFITRCTQLALEYDPKCVDALLLESHYQTKLTLEIASLLEARNPAILKEISPEGYRHFEKMQALYRKTDDLGYEETPPEIYAKWFDHVNSEKQKAGGNPASAIRKEIR